VDRYLVLMVSAPKSIKIVNRVIEGLKMQMVCRGVFESVDRGKAQLFTMLIERLGGSAMLLKIVDECEEEHDKCIGVAVIEPKDVRKGYRLYLVEMVKRFGIPIMYSVSRGCISALLPSAKEVEALRSYLRTVVSGDERFIVSKAMILRRCDLEKLPRLAKHCFSVLLCRKSFDKVGITLEDVLHRWRHVL